MARLREKYYRDVLPGLVKTRGYGNVMQVPRMVKIVVNMGVNSTVEKDVFKSLVEDLAKITGQHPQIRKARMSISNFKLREGMPVGARVTLRGRRMYEFFDRLVNTVLPRLRDFRGLSRDSFDRMGNYSFGLTEQTIFPEINPDDVKKAQGMDITIVTTGKNAAEALEMLSAMGVPFAAGAGSK